MEQTEIKIGDRVKLKGDSNSPEMTVTRDLNEEFANAQAVQNNSEKPIKRDCNAIFECSYFTEGNEDDNIPKRLERHNFHKDALKKLTEVQSTNKQ